MKAINKSLIAALVVLVLACSSSKEDDSRDVTAGANSEMAPPPPPAGGEEKKAEADASGNASTSVPVFERKLIKNGDVSFRTKSITETKKKIQTALTAVNGYIAKESASDYRENPSEVLTVRVPAKDFDRFLERILEGVEELDAKYIDIQDVTAEFVDIEARLRNKKQLEAKYQDLLAKASNMNDILSIEREINSIREEIESTEGRLKYLSNQVSYSTLQIHYYEHRNSGFNFGGKLGDALQNGGTGFLWFIIVVVQLWPMWLIGGLLWWLIVWLIRRNRKK